MEVVYSHFLQLLYDLFSNIAESLVNPNGWVDNFFWRLGLRSWFLRLFALGLSVSLLLAGAGAAYVALYVLPELPDPAELRDVRYQVPLRVYSADGLLMAEYGEKRRTPVAYEEIPAAVRQAFLAAEDDRFFDHPGVDYQGLMRAAWALVRTGQKSQGGSTITMQVARNFFLSREKSYRRKLNEIFLALKIEREFSKEEILELYLNKIFLGNRAYGVGAAAEIYYGKPLQELTLAQAAMIAGLPKAPSKYNPIANPGRSLIRRDHILGRMLELGYIDQPSYETARQAPVTAVLHGRASRELEADYVAEMVRSALHEQYGDSIYESGMRVYTSVRSDYQETANRALRAALLAYEERHGYRGPEKRFGLEQASAEDLLIQLRKTPVRGGLRPAIVLSVAGQSAELLLADDSRITLEWESMSWARPHLSVNRRGPKPEVAADVLAPGDLVRIHQDGEGRWRLAQVPAVSGSFVALDPEDGGVLALVGGFDYFQSKFNRAVQGRRQPGSGFKPFIYSAALANGYTLATLVNDAPVVFNDPGLENQWRPENYSGRFFGPTRLHEGLVKSRNLISIRLLQDIGVGAALEHAANFGLPIDDLPRNLSLALGSGELSQWQLAAAYAVFANGGYRIEPYFIQRVESYEGEVLFEANPRRVCTQDEAVVALEGESRCAPRVLDERNLFLMRVLMRDVVARGTARAAGRVFDRRDLAGKTGTSNEQRDAWFTGFNHDLVASAWVGFDGFETLGSRETGGKAALPMWIDFMRVALQDSPERPFEQPAGIVTVRIDPQSGEAAPPGQRDAIFEFFRQENAPQARESTPLSPASEPGAAGVEDGIQSLF